MAKASINIQVASGNSEKHMDRESKTTYLLDPDSENNEYQTFKSSTEYLSAAKVAAKEITGRTMQKLAEKNFIQEAVLNLEENHTLEDVKKVFDNLKEEFGGFEVFKIAVHKDEGYFYHKKEELEYRPNRDIFYNEKDKTFYLDKNNTKEADLNQFEKRYNYHAHVLFTKFDMSKGKNARLNKSDMRKIQTITAKTLGMERGEEFSKAKRKSHWQLKEAHDLKRDTKKEILAKVKDVDSLKKEIKAEMIAEGGHTKEDYQALNKQFKELKELVKAKELTIKELAKQRNKAQMESRSWEEGKTYKELHKETKEEILELEEENKALEAKISDFKTLDVEIHQKEDKNDLKAISETLNEANEVGDYDKNELIAKLDKFQKERPSDDFVKLIREQGKIKKPSILDKRHTVTFEIQDLQNFYDKLFERDADKIELIEKAKDLLNKFEKPLKAIKNYVHEHFIVPREKAKDKERQEKRVLSKEHEGMQR